MSEHILITCRHTFQRYQANAQDTKKDDGKSKTKNEMKSAMLRKLDEKLVIKADEMDKSVEQA